MIPILVMAVFGLLYALLYFENQKAPRPEGCELIEGGCASCKENTCDFKV